MFSYEMCDNIIFCIEASTISESEGVSEKLFGYFTLYSVKSWNSDGVDRWIRIDQERKFTIVPLTQQVNIHVFVW